VIRRVLPVLLAAAACRAGGPNGPRIRVTIPEGASLSAAADSLAAHHVIGSAAAFKFYARVLGESDEIKAGTYELVPDLPVLHVLRVVTSGREALRRLVIPEGLMLTEVAQDVQAQLGVPADSFVAAAHDSALAAEVDDPTPLLEGYLYPSTYLVRYGVTAHEVVKMMVDEFQAQWRPEWNARLGALHMTRHQVVTLASIIEGEVRFGPDRPYVSSVYHNRLDRGMRLQADPTVIYALGHRRRLYEKDYGIHSPYNTYLIDGLPPTPINQPSAADIEAALYPAHTNLLYLVARPDGKHVFSRTLREHLQAVAQVRRMDETPAKVRPTAKRPKR
jgi:peptidoglycan lytic transglycosylase G